ncbi:MAG: metallophosphoesterase [Oscillospiraceae bacterium]|nr:metallophosphoesterase [Oscillospiraceae bacterium]
MILYLVGMVCLIFLSVLGVAYLVGKVGKLDWIRRLSGGKAWKNRSISAGLLLGLLTLFSAWLSLLDAAVILLHSLLFLLIFDLLSRGIKQKQAGTSKQNQYGWLALAATSVYLILGYYQCIHVYKTEYKLNTKKVIETLRIAILSDSHIGVSFDGAGFASHIHTIMQEQPDLILIPGDYVDDDTRREDMLTACRALGEAAPKYGVWFAYGNHDKGYFNSRDFSAADLAQALEENGVHILEDEAVQIGTLCIVGRRDASSRSRRTLSELLEDVPDECYIIVMDHQPTDYENEAATKADLVVSGHTHGGQMIPLNWIGELFGENDRTYGHEQRNGTDFVVTSGISDWVVHFKTGTCSEYVILTVAGS